MPGASLSLGACLGEIKILAIHYLCMCYPGIITPPITPGHSSDILEHIPQHCHTFKFPLQALLYPLHMIIPRSPFHLHVSVETGVSPLLPEVDVLADKIADIPCPLHACHHCEENILKDKGDLGVPSLIKDPLPLGCRYSRNFPSN